jgi:hypothetical protein
MTPLRHLDLLLHRSLGAFLGLQARGCVVHESFLARARVDPERHLFLSHRMAVVHDGHHHDAPPFGRLLGRLCVGVAALDDDEAAVGVAQGDCFKDAHPVGFLSLRFTAPLKIPGGGKTGGD